ncbi:MAG: CDP-diacylglycerol--glycerol-3-phosphate 3-phosphatidyltransferase [Alphaproteobacteria bacterium]
MYNLPNMLTISRIVVIPVIFLSIYIHNTFWDILAGVLFIVAAVTDYFDGYFARSRNQISLFGRLLDPIADKLLVVAALLIIVANRMVDNVSFIPVMVILCREVLVSGLREFLANVKVSMPVTRLAKWKTGFQMASIGFILFGGIYEPFRVFGEFLLWIAGVLTFITGYEYFKKSLDYVKSLDKKESVKTASKAIEKTEEKISKTISETAPAPKKVAKSVAKPVAKTTTKKTAPKTAKPATKKVASKKAVKTAKKTKKEA